MKIINVIKLPILALFSIFIITTGCQAQDYSEVRANDILKKIENGEEIYLENVHITGEFNLSKIDLNNISTLPKRWQINEGFDENKKTVKSRIKIKNSIFEDDSDFSNIQFAEYIYLSRVNFRGNVNFNGANFQDLVCFFHVNFNGQVDFSNATFKEKVYFYNTSFNGVTLFINSNFYEDASFDHSNFNSRTEFANVQFNNTDFRCAKFVYVEFPDVIFNGDADFSDVKFGDAYFWNADFKGYANYKDVSFSSNLSHYKTGDAYFIGAKFNRDVNFYSANFDGDADFGGAKFNRDVNFYSANFNGDADFNGAIFNGSTLFNHVRFGGVSFSNAIFNGETDFYDADFNEYGYFCGSCFYDKVSFHNAFFSHAYFEDVTFKYIAEFSNSIFNGYTDFSNTKFNDYTDFSNTKFNDYTDFSNIKFNNYTDFSNSRFKDYAKFSNSNFNDDVKFYSADFNKVFFINTTFTKVNLNNIYFEHMEVNWSTLENTLIYDGRTYINLIKNFRNIEQYADADNAYYQYRRINQKQKKISFSKVSDMFMWLTCGYGVKPLNALIVGLITILIFSCIFYRDYNNSFWHKNEIISNINDKFIININEILPIYLKQKVIKYAPSWCSFYVSWVSFTTLGTVKPKNGTDKLAMMLEGLLGWLILALFLVTLANIMIRP